CRLKIGEDIGEAALGAVDLVDEDETRDVEIVELLQNKLKRRDLLVIWLAHHNRRIAARQRGACLLREFNGSRAIDEGVRLIHVSRRSDIELDAHAVGARFGRSIAQRCLVRYFSLALDGAGAEQESFEKRRLAAQIRAHECNAPWTPRFSAVRLR